MPRWRRSSPRSTPSSTELGDGSFGFAPTDEDIHTAIERRVTELAGEAGAKLHTGRSRNDQVATALRLYVRREGAAVAKAIVDLQRVLVDRAAQAGTDVYLPGYTHLQRAQPVLLAHHLLAHFWSLARDVERLVDALQRADVSPLGAGALAGSSLPLDPDGTASDLGFAASLRQLARRGVATATSSPSCASSASLLMVHLSRLGEEIVLWTSDEFGFMTLADEYATGSSMLPQKKNPDIAELARGKAGRVIGNLTGVLATLKGLPLSYNRDLQEDKEPLFDTFDTVRLALVALTGLLDHGGVRRRRHARRGRRADGRRHRSRRVARRARACRSARRTPSSDRSCARRSSGVCPLDELVMTEPRLGPDALACSNRAARSQRRSTPGGGGPEPFRRAARGGAGAARADAAA